MKLIIDCGSTKADWVILNGNNIVPSGRGDRCVQPEPFQHSSDMRRMESGVRRDQRRLSGVGDILAGP